MKSQSIGTIKNFFFDCSTPIYFVSSTGYNLFGLENFIKNVHFISYFDIWNGDYRNTLVPLHLPPANKIFEDDPDNYLENLNHILLQNEQVRSYMNRSGFGKIAFLFFNKKTEEIVKNLYPEFEICLPSSVLRAHFDSKMTSTRICNELGFPAIPYVLCTVRSFQTLLEIGSKLQTSNLVIQFPYGDSGHSTFFISNEEDWNKYSHEISKEPTVKVMKKIECYSTAIEACATKRGIIVTPLQTELIGIPELTSYKGGWCGNEIFGDPFHSEIRDKVANYTRSLGMKMKEEGYRGYFEVDFLIEKNTNNIYVSEINPRISGATILTSHSLEIPLFLFHLLEWFNEEIEFDVDEINRKLSQPQNIKVYSQLIIKHTGRNGRIKNCPQSGLWKLNNGNWSLGTPKDIENEYQAFFMNSTRKGEEIHSGNDLGRLVVTGRLLDNNMEITKRAQEWIQFVKSQFQFQ